MKARGMEGLRAFGGVFFSSITATGLLLSLSIPATVNAEERFCPEGASVDLTNATRNETGFLTESGNFFPIEIVRNEENGLRGCMCDVKLCVPLCSSPKEKNSTEIWERELLGNDLAKILPVYTTNLTLENAEDTPSGTEERFNFFSWNSCLDGNWNYLDPDEYKTGDWFLIKNGSLFFPRKNDTEYLFQLGRYCLRKKSDNMTYIPMVCTVFPSDPFDMVMCIGGLISMPFLIATIFVYSVLPELKNIHGANLRCYLGCLLFSYIVLTIDLLSPPDFNVGTLCRTLGFFNYFLYLARFLWLNVMCFDMWWKFGGSGYLRGGGKAHDRKTFIWYSIYAWGTPTLMTGICLGLEFSPSLSDSTIKPGFRQGDCWFRTTEAEYLYLVWPIYVTIVCNVCLFVLTTIKLIQHKRKTHRQLSSTDSKRHDDNKLLLSVYLRLFVIMGISWFTELVSEFADIPEYLWHFTTMLSIIQGIPIFVMFVCKKKIWQSLKMRFGW